LKAGIGRRVELVRRAGWVEVVVFGEVGEVDGYTSGVGLVLNYWRLHLKRVGPIRKWLGRDIHKNDRNQKN